MAIGLLINKKDLKRYTVLDGNIDENLYLPQIELAQETHIQKLLGSDLYRKIEGLVANGTLGDGANSDYKYLVDNFINKATIFYSMLEIIPIISYNASNNGLGKKTSEIQTETDNSDINFLTEKYRDLAEHYANLCKKYICKYSTKFPEYNTNTSEDIYPEEDVYFTTWEL